MNDKDKKRIEKAYRKYTNTPLILLPPKWKRHKRVVDEDEVFGFRLVECHWGEDNWIAHVVLDKELYAFCFADA